MHNVSSDESTWSDLFGVVSFDFLTGRITGYLEEQ